MKMMFLTYNFAKSLQVIEKNTIFASINQDDARMIKKILLVSMAMMMFFGMPSVCRAETAIEIIDNDYQTVTISVQESVLHVTGANGQTIQIYNVAGVMVKSIKVEGNDRHYELNLGKGCYIVKVGKTVRKVSIK